MSYGGDGGLDRVRKRPSIAQQLGTLDSIKVNILLTVKPPSKWNAIFVITLPPVASRRHTLKFMSSTVKLNNCAHGENMVRPKPLSITISLPRHHRNVLSEERLQWLRR